MCVCVCVYKGVCLLIFYRIQNEYMILVSSCKLQ